MKLDSVILINLLEYLNEIGTEYCIINNYELLPESIPSDVDIVIDRKNFDNLDAIIRDIADRSNVHIIQKIWHGYQKCAYILSPLLIDARFRLQLDFVVDYGSPGYPLLMRNKDLLEGRKPYKSFSIPAPATEAVLLLMRRVVKNDLHADHMAKLRTLFAIAKPEIESRLRDVFGGELSVCIFELVESGNSAIFRNKLPAYRRALKHWTERYTSIGYRLKYGISAVQRVFHRIRFPVGFSVVLLGPDGSGKSTIANFVLERISGSFHGGRVQYWRPYLLPAMGRLKFWNPSEESSINPRPHDHPQQNTIKSLLRFSYYFLDYVVGYPVKIYWKKVRKKIIIFDRYYYDYLVDLRRYQFNVPSWLPRLLLPYVPAPDMTIYLDGKPEKLMERKQELSLSELSRQVACFRALIPRLPRATLVETDKPIDDIVKEIAANILENKACQTRSILNK